MHRIELAIGEFADQTIGERFDLRELRLVAEGVALGDVDLGEAEIGNSLLSRGFKHDFLARRLERLHGLAALAQHIAVVGAAESAVGGDDEYEFAVGRRRWRGHQRVRKIAARRAGNLAHQSADAVGVGPSGLRTGKRRGELRGRDHLHGLGDALNGSHRDHALLELADLCHRGGNDSKVRPRSGACDSGA